MTPTLAVAVASLGSRARAARRLQRRRYAAARHTRSPLCRNTSGRERLPKPIGRLASDETRERDSFFVLDSVELVTTDFGRARFRRRTFLPHGRNSLPTRRDCRLAAESSDVVPCAPAVTESPAARQPRILSGFVMREPPRLTCLGSARPSTDEPRHHR